MSMFHQYGFNDHAHRLRAKRARENVITAFVLSAMIVSCAGATVLVFVSWFGGR